MKLENKTAIVTAATATRAHPFKLGGRFHEVE